MTFEKGWLGRGSLWYVAVMVARLSYIDEDPLLALVQLAPVVEATPEEEAAFEVGLADIRAGRTVRREGVVARLLAREQE